MKTHLIRLLVASLAFLAAGASATVHYVALNSANPVPPYADWSTAATNIQNAVDASTDGDLVLVTNGIYQTGGRALDSSPPTNRVAVTKAITLKSVNGPLVTLIKGYQMPGTTNGAAAIRCVYLTNGATLAGFTLTNGGTYKNLAGGFGNEGGGVFCQSTNLMSPVSSAIISNCWLLGNSSVGDVAWGGILNNCILSGNSGGGASYCVLNNCTVVGNSSLFAAGGVNFSTANNCVLYYNNALNNNYWGSTLNYCCTTPLPNGTGNITNEPVFVNLVGDDFHLKITSPCINSGDNAHVTSATDFEGNPRIVGGTVDIGAYEFQSPVSRISYAWLQQYDLPINTNVDFSDVDGDGMSNWQEWRAGTDPTNPLSVLKMLTPAPTNNPSGVMVSWQSVSGATYYLQQSTSLGAQLPFSTLQSNIVAQAGATSYMDTNAVGSGPFFYRVGVQ